MKLKPNLKIYPETPKLKKIRKKLNKKLKVNAKILKVKLEKLKNLSIPVEMGWQKLAKKKPGADICTLKIWDQKVNWLKSYGQRD